MSGISVILIALLLAALIIVIISIVVYNRRLDRVARGEVRDTHSSIPEPGTTTGVVYRVILMGVLILTFFTVSSLSGKISSLESMVNSLRSETNQLSYEVNVLRQELEMERETIADSYMEVLDIDYEAGTADILYEVTLSSYSEDTSVSLQLGDASFALASSVPGTWTAELTCSLYASFYDARLLVTENGQTANLSADFPEDLVWYAFPLPSLSCSFSSGTRFGKLTYEGSYTVIADQLEQIESVTITYLTAGKELKTMDITEETRNQTLIELEKGLELDTDLTFQIEITTKDGFRIIDKMTVIYIASPDFSETDSLRILDPNGRVVWEDDYK